MWRWLSRLVILVVVLIGAGLLSLRLFLASEYGSRHVRFLLVAGLSQTLGTDVRLGSIQLTGLATLEVQDLSVDDYNCEPLLRIAALRLSWRPGLFWQGFWKGTLLIPLSTLEVDQPRVYLYQERATGLLNLDRLFSPDTTPAAPTKQPIHFRIPQLLIREGRFIFRDSTAADTALLVRRGFMNYANLQLGHLNLTASVEKHADRLFVHVVHLEVSDTAAGVKLDSLSLVLRAYPDSTVVDHLFLHMGDSRLVGKGKFLQEGLDKLFRNTDTKQFLATIEGVVGWQDISAWSGDSLPLRGRWRVETALFGDLMRFRWKRLRIETGEGLILESAGEIWHYARPKNLYWDVQVQRGLVSLSALGAGIPEVSGWPQAWDTLRVWSVTGRSVGSLYSYWFTGQLPGVEVVYAMEKVAKTWSWSGKARLRGWSVSDLIPGLPIRNVYGEVALRGLSFDLERWSGTAQATLSGAYDTIDVRQLTLSAEADSGVWQGEAALRSALLSVILRGAVRFEGAPLFQVAGEVDGLPAALWGGAGSLAGKFQSNVVAPSWKRLQGQMVFRQLLWQRPDTTLPLGSLTIELDSGRFSQLSLSADGWEAGLVVQADWERLIEEVRGIAAAIEQWSQKKKPPVLPDSVEIVPFSLRLTLQDGVGWWWLHLGGLPGNVIGGAAEATLSVSPDGWRLISGIDSLILPVGELHGIRFEARGQWQNFWSFTANLTIAYGEQYLLFRELSVGLEGAYPEGFFRVASQIGRQDSLLLQGAWYWPGGFDLQIGLESGVSFFMLAGERWNFPEKAVFTLSDSTLTWQASARSSRARLASQGSPSKFFLEAENLPLHPLLEIFGADWPLEGIFSLRWQQGLQPLLSVGIDSLAYAGRSYPAFRLVSQPRADTLPIQLAWGKDLTGTGYYVLRDTTSPLFLRLSGHFPAGWLAPFVNDYLEGLGGHFRFSRLIVRGSLSRPELIGDILLDKARAYIPFLRLAYVADGVLKCRGDTVWVLRLPLTDPNQKMALLDGYIALGGWTRPHLNLTLQVKEGPVRLLSTRASVGAYLYGEALIERGELRFAGPWDAVGVGGFVRFAEGTDLTLPVENYLRTEKRSYVRFVGRTDTLRPILQAPAGLSLRVSLFSAPGARFRVLFDSRTGDEIIASGSSNLFLRITPEGSVSIVGSYEVTAGEYRLSLRGIVGRTLEIEPGSRITWDGDLYQGRLRLSATYKAFTSLRMIDSTYTATFPVEVRLLMGGTLLSPELRFQVDIPNLTGNPSPLITLFLQRLQNDEQERNRQVFALLALGTFLPPEQGLTASQTTSGVGTTLSEFLSAQLSGLLGQVVGRQVGIGFSVGQWNEISTQVRLSLGGRLSIQREGVLIAPGQGSPTLGNLSARYRLLPPRVTSPTQLQLEAEAFNRQTFFGGSFGTTTQGLGLSLRKSFFLPSRRKKRQPQ